MVTGNVPLVRASIGTRTGAAPSVIVTRRSLPSGKASLLLRSRTFTCSGSLARLVRVMGSSVVRPARVMVRAGTWSTDWRSSSSCSSTAAR